MKGESFWGDIVRFQQRHHGSAEKPVAEEIGHHVHQDGGVKVPEAYGAEEMNGIVGSQKEQGAAHHASREQIVTKDFLVGHTRQKHVETKEQEEGKCQVERVVI